ncbi:MAG: IMP dehydrogenase [Vicinamibacterales bacterium]
MSLLERVHGCTFDDFLLAPRHGRLLRRDPASVDLSSRLTRRLTLRRPIVSANMDTVTRAAMAVVLAEEGGIGVVDRGFRVGDIGPQVTEVLAVKRTQHGVIGDPHAIGPRETIASARQAMARTGVGTLAVVDEARRLVGLVTERDLRFAAADACVADRMTARPALVVHEGPVAPADAERLMLEHKIKKLPLIGADGRLTGLVTAKDLLKHRQHPFATRDAQGRLMVGAAVGATGDYLERAAEVLRAGADVIVIDIAHGHSAVMDRAIREIRGRFGDVDLVAGNVATAEGATFLAERGVDAVKVGIGPGGGCSTRLTTNFGVPQLEAIVRCRQAVGDAVPVIADGGIRRDGALALALLVGGDTAMLGSAFAGTEETPGEIVMRPVVVPESQRIVQVPFKVFRGMASLGAMRDRLDLEDAAASDVQAMGAEGLEFSVPARGSVRGVIRDMLKHLCSAVSYGGAESLAEMRERLAAAPDDYLIRLSEASRRESFDR